MSGLIKHYPMRLKIFEAVLDDWMSTCFYHNHLSWLRVIFSCLVIPHCLCHLQVISLSLISYFRSKPTRDNQCLLCVILTYSHVIIWQSIKSFHPTCNDNTYLHSFPRFSFISLSLPFVFRSEHSAGRLTSINGDLPPCSEIS